MGVAALVETNPDDTAGVNRISHARSKNPMAFHERLDLPIDLAEGRTRFLNRVQNLIFVNTLPEYIYEAEYERLSALIAADLGDPYSIVSSIYSAYVRDDFYRCLQTLESIYAHADNFERGDKIRENIDFLTTWILQLSEIDLGIRWESGRFRKVGAKLLDEHLVNDQLKWLRHAGYETVLDPFEKGLNHYLESIRRPELLADVITDQYEALEALAKIVTGKNKDLSANREAFIKEIKASDGYKRILKSYIRYANEFRHAAQQDQPRPEISPQ